MSLVSTKPSASASCRQARNSSPATSKTAAVRHHAPHAHAHAHPSPGQLKLPASHASHASHAHAPAESANRRSRPRHLETPPRALALPLPLPSTSPSHSPSPSPIHAKQRRGRPARQHSPPSAASTAPGRHDSSADEWDMPPVLPAATPSTLTWQQLEAAPTPRRARTESATPTARKAPPALARPILSGSLSDSASAPRVSAEGALTWQQELLNSPAAPSPTTTSYGSAPASNSSPHKARRNQLRDEMTFGVSALSFDDESPAPSFAPAPRRAAQPILVQTQTPIKVARYAGAEFQNSPSPASLPKPSFLLRRTPVALAHN